MEQALKRILTEFAAHPVSSAKALRQLLELDRQAFFQTVLPLLRSCPGLAGFPYLLTLLMMENMLLVPLADSSVFTFEEAVAIGRQIVKIDPLFDMRIMRSLADARSQNPALERLENGQALRLLEILAALSDGARIMPALAQWLHHPSPHIRSKAALLMGRVKRNHRWVEQRLAEPDARVRANALESLWDADKEGSRETFLGALADSNNRVVGNALLGLHRLGDPESIPRILDLLTHPDENFRLTGIWVMGESGDVRFLPFLAGLLSQSGGKLRAGIFRAIGKLKRNEPKRGPAAALAVYVAIGDLEPGGWGSLWAGVRQAGSGEAGTGITPGIVTGIKPTQFVLYEDGRPVTDFTMEEEANAEGLSLAFALPRIAENDNALHRACEEAVIQALCHKRKNDAWAVLKYICDPEGQEAIHAVPESSIAGPNQAAEAPAPLGVIYQADPAPITGAVSQPGARSACATDPVAAVRRLLTTITTRPPRFGRHVLLVWPAAAGQVPAAVWRELAQLAQASKTALHAFALVPEPEIAAACRTTGGIYIAISALAQMPKAITSLCATLPQHYKIRYRSQLPEFGRPATLKLGVYLEAGWGQETIGDVQEGARVAEVA